MIKVTIKEPTERIVTIEMPEGHANALLTLVGRLTPRKLADIVNMSAEDCYKLQDFYYPLGEIKASK
jgi:hypothetical protein